ncbi:uncharacterized protein CXorf65 homolog isoform X1 [Stylophora pistillata]|uniref:uncharacterized protein CXorf65 homolog isoform X1 n=1 Tax=Stylophora pistillata TaxID=50429 RepID=UPI000C055767|nr:uncharacterized protein CXorf65 homolog isoform X1 [Stylophora pistillata]
MFITVVYGEQEEALFNTDCRLKLLLDCINKRCKCEVQAEVDLCEVAGYPKYLQHQPQESYATNFLKPREKYVLIQMEKENGRAFYKPLLRDKSVITDHFLASLEKDMAKREGSRSPGADRLRSKRNSLKPGRACTSRKTKPRALSIKKNS